MQQKHHHRAADVNILHKLADQPCRKKVSTKQKSQPKEKDEVSLEDEEHSFTSCFFGPQNFRFRPNLLRQVQHWEAVTTKACSGKHILTVRRHQGASEASHVISWSLLYFIFLWRANGCTRVHGL